MFRYETVQFYMKSLLDFIINKLLTSMHGL